MLNATLVCVGRLKAGAERDLVSRYLDRAKTAGRPLGLAIAARDLPESPARRPEDRKAEEAQAIRAAVGGGTVLAFDERGRAATSPQLAEIFRAALDAATPLSLVIGGPDGLDTALREAATHVVAFGAMTWPHQLVRVMAAEQIYRAVTILAGHPYHRA